MKDEDVLPLSVTSCFILLCNSIETFSLQYNSVIPALNASAIKEVMWCYAETGTLCFHQAQSSAVATRSLLSLDYSLEDNEDNHHSSFFLCIHRSGKLHASFLRLGEGLNPSLPEVD